MASTLKSLLCTATDAEQLSLAYASIGDAGCTAVARYIRDNVSLMSLDLRGNNTCANGLVILAHAVKNSPSLVSLSLKWNKVGLDASGEVCARGLLALSDVLIEPSCTLRYLDLRNNNLKGECAPYIAEILRRNVNLLSVDLSWNELGVGSGPQLLEAIRQNKTLVECQLSGNQFSDAVLNDIAIVLRHNRISTESRPMSPIPPDSPDGRRIEKVPECRSPDGRRIENVPECRSPDGRRIEKVPECTSPDMRRIQKVPECRSPDMRRIENVVPEARIPDKRGEENVGEVLSINEEEVRNQLRAKEISDPDDQILYRQVGDLIDLLVMDAHRARRYRMDSELRKRVTARGFSDREHRCTRELQDLHEILVRAREEKLIAEERLKAGRSNVARIKAEKDQALSDRRQLEEISKSAMERIEYDTREALRVRAETEADLYSLKRKVEDHKVENERLRVYLKRCKADLDSALQ